MFSSNEKGSSLRRVGTDAVCVAWLFMLGACGGERFDTEEGVDDLSAQCTSSTDGVCEATFSLASNARMPYYRTYPLGEINPVATQAIIAIHGTSRNHRGQFNAVVRAARDRGVLRQTLVLAPKFQTSDDNPGSNELFWSSGGWKEGNSAISSNDMSSFAVTDRLIERLLDQTRFPALRRITIIGHSAGGQYTQRYAAGGRVSSSRVQIRYIVSNPSSYMYLNEVRKNASGQWRRPDTGCAYNDYKYGLRDRNAYMGALSEATLRAQFIERNVIYFLGEDDTLRDSDLDVSCAADFQGRHRLERGRNFAQNVDEFFSADHQVVTAPSVGHSATDMYTSPRGRAVLFP